MAITINDQPYEWAVRGQKLMIIASSTETANTGFKYGIDVVINGGATYTFFVSAAPDDRLYFDLSSLLEDMRNTLNPNKHYLTDDTADDPSKLTIDANVAEYWIVGGVLTLNSGSSVALDSMLAVNGYFQVIDGYKPNVQTGGFNVRYALTNTSSYMMSDRDNNTSPFYLAQTWSLGVPTDAIWIPVFDTDYGLLSIPGNNTYLTNNDAVKYRITIFSSTGVPTTATLLLNGYDIENLPVYPANLNDFTTLAVKPSLFPNWRAYTVAILNAANSQRSETYIFYNAAVYGQCDCRFYNMRLAWVNSRGGWDYFNFIKKSETTDEIERKKYRKVLFDGTTQVFSATDRGLVERRNMVQQVISISSDFITEGEFKLLRSLLVSNQVEWLTEDELGKSINIPVNIDDTSYVEKNTRDGKLYNVTLKMRIANQYWT